MEVEVSLLLGYPPKKIGLLLPPEKCSSHLPDEPESYKSGLNRGVEVSQIEEVPLISK
jgi:hypothetical protein